jgi:hypothetical protein
MHDCPNDVAIFGQTHRRSRVAERESVEAASQRWHDLELLQTHYDTFDKFLIDVIEDVMGFICTEVQIDIGEWVAYGPQYRMVQAQRGQAKTTITAAYAVWKIIHDPSTRVLIISAGSDMATEIANWIIQIINNMDVLECLRPDRSAGDRSSVTGFDIHYTLKGPEKSASITCIGITSNMQGKRADLLIADDIESAKNSQTQTQRARIHHLTLDFTSICTKGEIVWLGTPQSVDSVYNTLPGRGVQIRIWPGRYPTVKEEADYEGFLAPYVTDRMKADPMLRTGGGPTGDRGRPIDEVMLSETDLTKKEIDQGPSYFQLQHMLCTKLADADRFPLKVSQIRFLAFDYAEKLAPMTLNFVRTDENSIKYPEGFPIRDKAYRVQNADDFASLAKYHMYVDPAGGGKNGDELAYAVTGFLAGRVFLADVGGTPGGLTDEQTDWLTNIAVKWKPAQIDIEKNYGNGALASVWLPKLLPKHACAIEEVWETGQKELRIIDVLEPVLGSGKFICHEELIVRDWDRCQKYAADKRSTYSFFWQLSRITRDKGALIHDDRLDAVAGSVRHWVDALVIDDEKAKAAARNVAYKKLMSDPLGNGRPLPSFKGTAPMNRYGLSKIGHIGH